jgi:hypothetical protein
MQLLFSISVDSYSQGNFLLIFRAILLLGVSTIKISTCEDETSELQKKGLGFPVSESPSSS